MTERCKSCSHDKVCKYKDEYTKFYESLKRFECTIPHAIPFKAIADCTQYNIGARL